MIGHLNPFGKDLLLIIIIIYFLSFIVIFNFYLVNDVDTYSQL